ncbi:hypothetical protein [Treponema endosymbiont of Eucomonympha sp.]|uniref:hypothetical protein n=1 Tax=Treponema endosymbiont of Eucomonympha sp. TaxID=1580831 RepID=UPI000750EA40|nr:hypothetical protein [Treponema endosymbiont of Eucomonympha sp.]
MDATLPGGTAIHVIITGETHAQYIHPVEITVPSSITGTTNKGIVKDPRNWWSITPNPMVVVNWTMSISLDTYGVNIATIIFDYGDIPGITANDVYVDDVNSRKTGLVHKGIGIYDIEVSTNGLGAAAFINVSIQKTGYYFIPRRLPYGSYPTLRTASPRRSQTTWAHQMQTTLR